MHFVTHREHSAEDSPHWRPFRHVSRETLRFPRTAHTKRLCVVSRGTFFAARPHSALMQESAGTPQRREQTGATYAAGKRTPLQISQRLLDVCVRILVVQQFRCRSSSGHPSTNTTYGEEIYNIRWIAVFYASPAEKMRQMCGYCARILNIAAEMSAFFPVLLQQRRCNAVFLLL